MAKVYDDDLLYSECFFKQIHVRVFSQILPDKDHSDHLVQQFQDIQNVCQTTITANVMKRSLPNYAVVLSTAPNYGEGPATVTEAEHEAAELSCEGSGRDRRHGHIVQQQLSNL